MADTNRSPDQDAYSREVMRRLGTDSPFGVRRKTAEGEKESAPDPTVAEMRKNRQVNRKTANSAMGFGRGGAELSFATGRPRDPLFYWRQNNLPYEFTDNEELAKVRAFCRLIYHTDPVIGSCVDIYSKLPLLGMELSCKDSRIADIYTEMFGFGDAADDVNLNYEEFLIDVGREYWCVGEVWPFGTFNEMLGIWESEELLQPDDVKVERSAFHREPRYSIKLPETLRKVLQTKTPVWEYEKIIEAFPELINYVHENTWMPVSNILLRQLRFPADTFNSRGVPILTRCMRSVMQQEMLNAAMDSIADRLYTPLILVKLGASASDLGTEVPWIPTDDDRADFEEAMDAALSADFRALIYHFAVDIIPVFGREQMPDFSPDFERLEDRILQTFGLSRSLLTGASAGETYAADALNRDLISQLLTTYQRRIKSHFRQRALVVAEAQGHYDYDLRNGRRYIKTEEILEYDEETGQPRIVERPKLLVPQLHMLTMDLHDKEQERQFLELLRSSGVPISMRTRTRSLPFKMDDEIEQSKAEAVKLAVAEQETRREIYSSLRDQRLPVAQDLAADFTPRPVQMQVAPLQGSRVPMLGLDPVSDEPNLAPTPQDVSGMPPDVQDEPPPGSPDDEEDPDFADRPPESDEQREGMPSQAALFRRVSYIRQRTGATQSDDWGRLTHGPSHVGSLSSMRFDPESEDLVAAGIYGLPE